MEKNKIIDWVIRLVKGMFIGSGAILPGVSGGALAAVFGVYERMIAFLSDIRKDFMKNVFFFIPVGIGVLSGFFLLTYPINYFLNSSPVQTLWCFIGCIAGTFPALFKEAGKYGRKNSHLVITGITAIVAFAGLFLAKTYMNVDVPLNPATWVMAGAIFALGFIVPGLSPSNFLLYMNMYEPMTKGIKDLDFSIIIPVGIGGLLCILLLSKLMGYIMKKAYAPVFHFILGVVIASTAIVAPMPSEYAGISALGIVLTVVLFLAGLALGFWMGKLDEKYKPADESSGD